jgi:CBS domain-containing protein
VESKNVEVGVMKVCELMSPAVVAVDPKTPLREILLLMLRRHLNDIVVMDDAEQRLAGIVTYSDLSRRLLPTQNELMEHEEYIMRPESMEERTADITNVPVGEVMTRHVITVSPDTEVLKAGAIMTAHRVKQLPVLRGNKVLGIISHTDIGWGLMMRYDGRSGR